MKHWQVQGTMPESTHPTRGYKWVENVTAHVIAETAKRALELVELKRPNITVHSVTHRGKIDYIEDDAP